MVPRKYLKTLQSDDRLAPEEDDKYFANEITEQIISRLPVKSILRFRSVSKAWLSLISNPSFTRLQVTQAILAHRTAFFITAEDITTRERYFLAAPDEGGPVTHLMTLYRPVRVLFQKGPEYLNGLVCSVYGNSWCTSFHNNEAWVFNPSMRKSFELPVLNYRNDEHVRYFFGFNESRNEHMILGLIGVRTSNEVQIMIFSMSSYLWKKIDAIDISPSTWNNIGNSVCVNSIIHIHLMVKKGILAFDLKTEKFSTLKFPKITRDNRALGSKHPYLIKINGCIGIVSHSHVEGSNKMHIWILEDHENQFWVKETITYPESWGALYRPYDRPCALDSINKDEIIFSLKRLSRNVISSDIYNMKTECFRSIQFILNHPFLHSEAVEFHQIKCYIESLTPL